MAITVGGLVEGGVFCHDMGDVVLMYANGEVTVKFSVTDAAGVKVSEFEEQYYPNANSEIHISGLSEVMECYLQGASVTDLFAPDSNYKDVGGFATLSMEIYESGKLVKTCAQMFFQANSRTGLFPAAYKYFLSRFREREVFTDQLLTCAYIFRGQTLKCGIAWADDEDKMCYKEVVLATSGVQNGHIVMHQYKPSDIANRAGVTAEQLLYITLMLMDGTQRIDYMKMVYDSRKHKERTGFAFKNLFGVLEHIIFTGKNKHTADLEGSYSWIGRKYRKMHTDLTSSHTVCSGWIDQDTHDSVKDAIRSDEVYIVDELKLGDMVTITGIDLEYNRPSDKPVSAAITYRVSDKIQERFTRARQMGTRIFDDSFDKTFE